MAIAFEGRDGWLFLDGDTNQSVRQFTGNLVLDDVTRQSWYKLISVGAKLVTTGRYAFMVAPSKENVFPEFYPHARGGSPMIQQLNAATSHRIIDPTPQLKVSVPFLTYDREETHWNDWGAYIASTVLIKRLGFSSEALSPDLFEVRALPHSDLGIKMSPSRIGSTIMFNGRNPAKLRFHNGISNWGHVSVFENAEAPLKLSALFFGDSFGTRTLKFLSRYFSRLVFAHATSIDLRVVSFEKPDVLINEVTDRFLPYFQSSPESFSLTSMIAKKIENLPPDERSAALSRQQEYFGFSAQLLL